MMKIGIAIGTMQGGGAQRVVSVLSEYFVNKGYFVNIITTSDNKLDYDLDDKISLVSLSTRANIVPIKQIQCFFKLYAHIKKEKYDIILAFLPMTCIYIAMCKSLGCSFKMISSERMDPHQDPTSKVLRSIRNWAYKKSDGIVFQTNDAKEYFTQDIQNKSTIIYNPVNKNIPIPEYKNRDKRIVTAIRLEKQKNVEMLIDAFEIFHFYHPEYKLEIYGQGSLEKKIREKIDKHGLNNCITLAGFTKDIYECMKHASFFVLPSNYEGVSNSMLEALCMGIPVVSTDHPIGGAKMFIVNSRNGYLCPIGDSIKFAECMDKMVKLSYQQYSEMCKEAASVRAKLEPFNVCHQWERFILEC